MVRLLFRQPRADDPPASEGARPIGLAVVAVITGIALVGCSAVSRMAGDESASSTRSSGGAAVVAPQSEPYANDAVGEAAKAGGVPGSAPAPDAPLPTVDEGRDIIRTGNATLAVRSVTEAFESVRQIAVGAGGSVTDSSFVGSGDEQSAHLTLRVPVERFGDVVARLREVAVEVESITTGSTDVTEQVTDVEATLRNLRAVEAQYVALLSRTGSINEVLAVQDRLNQVRLQIDRTEARRQSLASRAEMSTITVSLHPAEAGAGRGQGVGEAVREAWDASLATLAFIGTSALVILVYSWWLIPFVVLGVYLARRSLRGGTPPAPPAAP
jgi:hypothetical protein